MRHKIFSVFVFYSLSITAGFGQSSTSNWTGFYGGLNAGISSSKLSAVNNTAIVIQPVTNITVPGRGIVVVPGLTVQGASGASSKITFTGGIQLGYMKQFKQWTAGLEGDVNYQSINVKSDMDNTYPTTILQEASPYGIHHSVKGNFTESIRVKIGYAVNEALIYIAAGPAFASLTTTAADYFNTMYWASAGTPPNNHPTSTQVRFVSSNNNEVTDQFASGYTFGVGYQWRLSGNKTLDIGYRYSDLSMSYTTSASTFDATPIDSRTTYASTINGTDEKIKIKSSQVTVRLNMPLNSLLKL